MNSNAALKPGFRWKQSHHAGAPSGALFHVRGLKKHNPYSIISEISVEILGEVPLCCGIMLNWILKKLIDGEMSQTVIADRLGATVSCVNKITRGREHIAGKTFIAKMEQIGYDVELTYARWDGENR